MFEDLLGKTLTKIEVNEDETTITFYCSDNTRYLMFHYQDCCETVYVEEVVGDLDTLLNSPILLAEVISNQDEPNLGDESWTWTFYKLSTNLGNVTIRWYGGSNGYYSEEVTFEEITDGRA